jgi:hypothetical protein
MAKHFELTEPYAIHPAAFISATDPALVAANDVQAGKQWVDTSSGPPFVQKVRDATNTTWQAIGTSGATPHNILSVTHSDTLADSVVQGDVIVGNATPKWARLAANSTATKKYLQSLSSGVPSWQQVDYADLSGTPGSFTPSAHNILSASHGDTLVGSVAQGDIIIGNATPKWARLAANATATNKYLQSVSSGLPSWQQIAYADLSGVPATFTATAHNILSATHGGCCSRRHHLCRCRSQVDSACSKRHSNQQIFTLC